RLRALRRAPAGRRGLPGIRSFFGHDNDLQDRVRAGRTMIRSMSPRSRPQPAALGVSTAAVTRVARARVRRWLGRVLRAVPGVVIAISDYARRREQIRHFEADELAFYALTVGLSIVLWGALLAIATRRAGFGRHVARVLLVALAVFAYGGQSY